MLVFRWDREYGPELSRPYTSGHHKVPLGYSSVGVRAFKGCSAIEKVTLPWGLREIGWEAFKSCYALKEINFPRGLKQIGSKAFADCRSLRVISFPKNAGHIEIKDDAFIGCTALSEASKEHILGCNPKCTFENELKL